MIIVQIQKERTLFVHTKRIRSSWNRKRIKIKYKIGAQQKRWKGTKTTTPVIGIYSCKFVNTIGFRRVIVWTSYLKNICFLLTASIQNTVNLSFTCVRLHWNSLFELTVKLVRRNLIFFFNVSSQCEQLIEQHLYYTRLLRLILFVSLVTRQMSFIFIFVVVFASCFCRCWA